MSANPANAVLEALERLRALTAHVSFSDGSDPLDDLETLADRLAALAWAAPVACHRLHTSDGKARWMWVDGAPSLQAVDDARNFGWTLELAYTTPHAPAKAREVTEADVRKAVAAYNWAHYSGIDICCEDSMRAALATFAEGAE